MKKFKFCLAVLMITIMMGGSALAYNAADHVKVAPNGIGDLLIFPYYFAYDGNYSTRITVINTSSTHSVVAKVVYRSFNWSFEVLDHLIYLSPSDVWTGVLYYGSNKDKAGRKVARLESFDDSMLGRDPGNIATADDFANITSVDYPLADPPCTDVTNGDNNKLGYVEVIEAASRLEDKTTTGYATGTRVAKRDIHNWYTNYCTPDQITNGPYQPVNVLTGYQENWFGVNAGATLKQAAVFADYSNQGKLQIAISTKLGVGAKNTLAELEAAMAKDQIAMPYLVDSASLFVHIFNFPTKLSSENQLATCAYWLPYAASPFWMNNNNKSLAYTQNIYDLMENTPGPDAGYPFSPVPKNKSLVMSGEVIFDPLTQGSKGSLYTEGWIRYNFGAASTATKIGTTQLGNTLTYTGTPVLASVLYWDSDRSSPAEANAAHNDGAVSVDRVNIPHYQYR